MLLFADLKSLFHLQLLSFETQDRQDQGVGVTLCPVIETIIIVMLLGCCFVFFVFFIGGASYLEL